MRRNGFTLIEMLMVIVVSGAILLIGYPKLNDALISSSVRGARTTIATMFAQARAASAQRGQEAHVAFSGNRAVVVVRVAPGSANWADTLGVVRDLNAEFGVTVTRTDDSLSFDPRGFGRNNGTVTVTIARRGHVDKLSVSAFGRMIQ